ncbi:MAG: hypothetical protein ABSG22_10570 [Sedimentisphaerales bacterium]|jgi:hypothetical protein
MPIPTEPGTTFWVTLKADKNKPAEKQRHFELRTHSAREMRKIIEAIDKARNVGPDIRSIDGILDILKTAVVGWENIWKTEAEGQKTEIPFDIEKLEDICTSYELGQLLAHYEYQGFTAEERKN